MGMAQSHFIMPVDGDPFLIELVLKTNAISERCFVLLCSAVDDVYIG